MPSLHSRLVLGALAAVTLWTSPTAAKSEAQGEETTSRGPRLSPFECHGRYESSTGNRTIEQIRIELAKKLDQLDEAGEPDTVRAMKYCVIARLKQRVGDLDAPDWFERAIQADPEEPGYELFYGMYWSMARGARGPVLEAAETHLYRALEKLEALEARGARRDYHDVILDWTHKRLVVLYQQDGQSLLPWKAYRQSSSGRTAPGLFGSLQARMSRDTRDFFYNSEARTFTGEQLFAESDVRAQRELTSRELWDLARAPLRTQLDARLRFRHNAVGALDVTYEDHHAQAAQIESFYAPTERLADVRVEQLGAGYERVVPLGSLFDVRLAGSYRLIERRGVVEFLPDRNERFGMFKLNPGVSRFFGSDKLTADLVYVKMDITDLPGGVPEQALREKIIRGAKLEYTFYSPLTVPAFPFGTAEPYRAATRGLSLYAGGVQDDETYGLRRVTRHDIYGGSRYDGPGSWAAQAQVTYYRSRTTFVDPNAVIPRETTDVSQGFSSVKSTLLFTHRIVDEETLPGVTPTQLGFGADMMNVVFPIHWEVATTGPKHFENVRGGLEVWLKIFQYGAGGTPLLFTAGYDAQYFYNLGKTMHLMSGAIRLGWGDL